MHKFEYYACRPAIFICEMDDTVRADIPNTLKIIPPSNFLIQRSSNVHMEKIHHVTTIFKLDILNEFDEFATFLKFCSLCELLQVMFNIQGAHVMTVPRLIKTLQELKFMKI